MIASRISLSALALVLVCGTARAQAADSAGEQVTAPPRPMQGAQLPDPDAAVPEAQPGVPVDRPAPAIEVNSLGSIDGPATGLLDAAQGGLGDSMWSGSARADIETMLARIPLVSPDPAIRALARRLVLTRAEAPIGPAHRALIAIRIDKLLDAGMIDEAGALAASVQLKNDLDFARVQADAILMAGRAGDTCGNLTSARLTEGELFWLQLRAYCAALSGDTAATELTRNVIDAEGLSDGAYNILVDDVLTHAVKPPGPIAKPTAMHVLLLRQVGLPIGGDLVGALGTSANLLALKDTRNPPEIRLAAAERIIRTGAPTSADLVALGDSKNTPASTGFVSQQLTLRRAALLETRSAEKAALVEKALAFGDQNGLFAVAAGLQADIAASIKPDAALRQSAPLIAKALLLAGKPVADWLSQDSASDRLLIDLVTPGRLGDPQTPGDLREIARHLQSDPRKPNAAAPHEALLLGLYDALGRSPSSGTKPSVVSVSARHWQGRRPSDDAMQALMQAAAQPDRKGEAVLRILDAVGARGPGDLAPDVSIEFVRTLMQLGLDDAALALAAETLLLYRPPTPPSP